ncbi:hypothetical protein [Pseudovibrio sp. Tun.PSC04-5.I4]|uniref:hypothetical protein n=1 Tax=Pseudovibrio sp. Tun.PSC04-5.I4 TaxID=1798213 RepID=UPI0008912C20|nr:hypothetical protein [Pseudovibrio sp. Tun.PSC04-5.I4]SDR44919.1 hypothetical protein SAMN04515695_5475 [Pseudovibrio sp. Tun.PSC04-5.I4]
MHSLFTIYELERFSTEQLYKLHSILLRFLPLTELGSDERRDILATLENVERLINMRLKKRNDLSRAGKHP